MNDQIENWLCDHTLMIERIVGADLFGATEHLVDDVTDQVCNRVSSRLLTDNQDWAQVAAALKRKDWRGVMLNPPEPKQDELMGFMFGMSRIHQEINA